MEFYLITAKCGHVGKRAYIPITFAVKAENGREAAKMVRNFPRVKRNHWDAILGCTKVDESGFYRQIEKNNNDPYLHVSSKQEQSRYVEDLESRTLVDNHQNEINKLVKKSKKPNLKYQHHKYTENYIEGYDYE